MRNLFILPLCILFPAQTLVSHPDSIHQPEGRFHLKQEVGPEYVGDEIVLKAEKELALSRNTLADTPENTDLRTLFERYCITEIQPVGFKSKTKIPHLYMVSIDIEALAQKKQQERAMRFRRLSDTDKEHEKQAIEEELNKQYSLPSIGEALTANSLIEYAEPHYFISLPHAPYYDTTSTGGQSPSTPLPSQKNGNDPNAPPKHKGGDGPNDPYLTDQWYLQKINAEKAWEIQTGSPDVRVAVISSGVDYTHEDLEGKIDLDSGYDFVSVEGIFVGGEDYGPRDDDPMDFHGIGTHAAGIIAATNDNGIGICGIAPDVTIVPLRVVYVNSSSKSGYQSRGRSMDLADALLYCGESDIDIIYCGSAIQSDSKLIKEAIDHVIEAGCLVVAPAGSYGDMTTVYPAAYDGVLSVGATNSEGDLVFSTGWGDWVDVYAPGENILSLRCGRSDMYGDGSHIYPDDENYYTINSTFSSAAIVTGLCALIASEFHGIDNHEIVQRVKALSANTEYQNGMGGLISGEVALWRSLALDLSLHNTIHVIGAHFKDETTGNGDWIAETGEAGQFIVYLRDMYEGGAEAEIQGTLTSDSPLITIQDGTGSWSNFENYKVGGNVDNPFEVVISGGAGENTWIDMKLTLTQKGETLCEKNISLIANPVVESSVSIYTSRIEGRFTAENSPYTIVNECWIPRWSNVIIEPGVELRFGDARQGLRVLGRLNVQGTENEKVVFTTTADAAAWGRICFYESNGESIINHAVIEKGYGCWRFPGGGGIYSELSDIVVNTTLIQECVGMSKVAGGICLIKGASVIEDCIIKNNKAYFFKDHYATLFPFSTPSTAGLFSRSQSVIKGCLFNNNLFIVPLPYIPPDYIELTCTGSEKVRENIFEDEVRYNPDYVDNDGNPLELGAGPLIGLYGDFVFENNIIRNNDLAHGNFVEMVDGSFSILKDNEIYNNIVDGISFLKLENTVVSGNTFTQNIYGIRFIHFYGGDFGFVVDNSFIENGDGGIIGPCLLEANCFYTMVLKNRFINNRTASLFEGNFKNFLTIENNIIANNQLGTFANDCDGQSLYCYNNVFLGNQLYNNYFYLGTRTDKVFSGNIFWDNSRHTDVFPRFEMSKKCVIETPQIQYSILDFEYSDTGVIYSDPLLNAPENLEFQLTAESPCVDAGPPDYRFNDTDGSRNDMGVHGGNPYKFYPRTMLDIGAVEIGKQKSRDLYLYNASEELLVIDGISVNPPFSLDGFEPPLHVEPKTLVRIGLTFTPLEDKKYEGTITIQSDSFSTTFGRSDYELSLTGRGTYYTVYGLEDPIAMHEKLVLDKEGGPYLIDRYYWKIIADVIVEPGVQVFFTEDSVFETVDCVNFILGGTESEPIRFSGLDGASWGGINFNPMHNDLDIKHVIFENIHRDYAFFNLTVNYEGVGSGNVHFINCTFANNTFEHLDYMNNNVLVSTMFRNTIFHNNENLASLFDKSHSILLLENCVVEDSVIDSIISYEDTIVRDCIDADPQFVDLDNGDYRLQDSSPCIGTGKDGENMGASGIASIDTSPPEMLSVTDAGEYTANASTLQLKCSARDDESAIMEYQCRILKNSTEGDVVQDWTTVRNKTEVTLRGVALETGETYYIAVKARNRRNLSSEVMFSDGITVRNFVRGDVNEDAGHNISDTIGILQYLFSQAQPRCLKAHDLNDDGMINIADAVYSLVYLFGGGAPPPQPFPENGLDQTQDLLPCNAPPANR